MTKHALLLKTFDESMAKLASTGDKLNWHSKEVYGAWLTQTFNYVSHSTRLLTLAASRFGLDQKELHSRFLEHSREEKNHEILAIRDLKVLGKTLADFTEFAETSAFYKMQYYWIEHVSPLAFYGYILCLEGFAVHRGGHFFKAVTENFGEKSASFLQVHKDEDQGHLKKALAEMSHLSEVELGHILQNFKESCALYEAILQRSSAADKQIGTVNAA